MDKVDRVNIASCKDIDVACGSKLLRGLSGEIKQLRDSLEEICEKASGMCETLNLVSEFKEQRKRKVKSMISEEAKAESSNVTEK